MKVGSGANRVRQNFDFRNHLIVLNFDLQNVVKRIDLKEFDRIFYNHSHQLELSVLTNVQAAVLFLEDRRFFLHRGFELRAPLRVVKRIVLGKRAGAVSTIDQQLVRIITGRYERTLRRKLREALLAFLLNFHRSKAAIFYTYLHEAYFGYRLEGCELTSRFLFSKPASELSVEEASFISCLLARPLPKAVFDRIESEKNFREITPDRIIKIGKLERLEWANHVESRYQYVLEMFPSIPKSLRMR